MSQACGPAGAFATPIVAVDAVGLTAGPMAQRRSGHRLCEKRKGQGRRPLGAPDSVHRWERAGGTYAVSPNERYNLKRRAYSSACAALAGPERSNYVNEGGSIGRE
jgi:hypothetical protein